MAEERKAHAGYALKIDAGAKAAHLQMFLLLYYLSITPVHTSNHETLHNISAQYVTCSVTMYVGGSYP